MNQEEFFAHFRDYDFQLGTGNSFRFFSVEDLYEAFKARMKEEWQAENMKSMQEMAEEHEGPTDYEILAGKKDV